MRIRLAACLMTAMALLSACSEAPHAKPDVPPQGDPQKKVGNDLRGYVYKSGVAVGEDYRALWAKAIMAGYDPLLDNRMPGAIQRTENTRRCTLPPPQERSETVVVHIPSGGSDMPMFRTTDDVLAANAKKIIGNATTAAKDKPLYGLIGGKKMVVDPVPVRNVVVTKTDAPVHLVLVSYLEGIWNIHTQPETTITGITILGPDGTGYVNAPEGTTVSVIAGATLERCPVAPAREPRDHWRYVKNTRNPNDEHLQKNRENHRKFAYWLRQTYPGNSLITALSAGHVLVGPAPRTLEERVPYNPVSGATVHIGSVERIVAMPREDYVVQIRTEATALAEQLAGATISDLKKTR